MNFKIKHKLLVLITLPTIVLIVFSLNHFNSKYTDLKMHNTMLVYSNIIKISSELMYALQEERGLSTSYINNLQEKHFKITLTNHLKKTDNAIEIFKKYMNNLDNTLLSSSNQNFLANINNYLQNLQEFRTKIMHNEVKDTESFIFYTKLINSLLSLAQSFETHSNDNETYNDTIVLKKLLQLQEFAGQERAFVSYMLNLDAITLEDIKIYSSLVLTQVQYNRIIKQLVQNSKRKNQLKKIHNKYAKSYFYTSRKAVEAYEQRKYLTFEIFKVIGFGGMVHDLMKYKRSSNIKFYKAFIKKKEKFDLLAATYKKIAPRHTQTINKLINNFEQIAKDKNHMFNETYILELYKMLEKNTLEIDAKKWFDITTQRINDIHEIEKDIILNIDNLTKKDLNDLKNSLLVQISLSLGTILLLLFGAIFIAKNITNSISNLQSGVKDFFDFLNFKNNKSKYITIDSNDEIYDIAQNINAEILLLEKNLEQDKDFINEATQIVRLMKDGDFSDKVYFEPINPHLKDLKDVLNELIALITAKIKEQTDSLEELNSSLEDKVFHQTLELHNQVKELTIARDKAVKAEVAKDEFLANMSHEIRTPLNAILGFVTILKKRVTDEKSLNYLKIIDSSGMSLLTIINDILDFSKIQSGKFTIFAYTIDPLEEFSNSALLFASKVYEKHLIYTVYIDPFLPKTISVDAVRVKQIISNILSNAIKFTAEDGEIRLTVSCKENNLIISVEDSGIGISKENIGKVFSAFEQADSSTTRKYGGTGLGLSISSKLASLMDGTLTVESQEGKGSTFTLSIPVDVIDDKATALIDKDKIANIKFGLLNNCAECIGNISLIQRYLYDFGAKDITQISEYKDGLFDILFFIPDDDYNEEIVNSNTPAIALLRSASIKLAELDHIQPLYAPFIPKSIITAIDDTDVKDVDRIEPPAIEIEYDEEQEVQYSGSILVAEDNKTNQMLISLMLDDYGLDYSIVNNGVEAVQKFKEAKFDMVLMDENMPELNGIGAMQQIKEYEKLNNVIITPIIALTACVLDSDKKTFLDAGMDGFVAKPINNKMLEIEFNKYLKRK